MSAVIFAPTGYPEVTPRARAKEAQPGTLKNGLMTGSSSIPAARVKPVEFISSLATKKGNREGTTMEDHRTSPSRADRTAESEKMTIHMTNSRHSAGMDNDFIYTIFDGFTASSIKTNTAITNTAENIIVPAWLLTLLLILFYGCENIPNRP
jgi:hypothetical protein